MRGIAVEAVLGTDMSAFTDYWRNPYVFSVLTDLSVQLTSAISARVAPLILCVSTSHGIVFIFVVRG